MKRRQFIQAIGAGTLLGASVGCATTIATPAKLKVVIVGGGFGGATAAKYLSLWGEGRIDITVVEPNPSFISCPISNLVIGGSLTMADVTLNYDILAKRDGVKLIHGYAQGFDAETRIIKLADGATLPYDRLILSPGVEFLWEQLPGMLQPGAQEKILHGWKAGAQTIALRQRVEAMDDGGTMVISIPLAPYRCPPGPYERACQVAHYFSQHKPKSKVIILDANPDVTSKGPLFKKAWAERYPNIVQYRTNFIAADVDAKTSTVISTKGEKVRADLLNLVPPQRAGNIAANAGLANIDKRWCEIDFVTFESTQAKNVHVLGDAIRNGPGMPKTAQLANQYAKVCAAAIVDILHGRAPNPQPMLTNTCYSFVSDKDVIHVATVHAFHADKKNMLPVPNSGGMSAAANELEGLYAMSWARNIWADSLL